jgi:hypothetical protein
MSNQDRSPRRRTVRGRDRVLDDGPTSSRVVAIIVALEKYRKPAGGDALPQVEFAHADAEAFASVLRETYRDLSDEDVTIQVIKDEEQV